MDGCLDGRDGGREDGWVDVPELRQSDTGTSEDTDPAVRTGKRRESNRDQGRRHGQAGERTARGTCRGSRVSTRVLRVGETENERAGLGGGMKRTVCSL